MSCIPTGSAARAGNGASASAEAPAKARTKAWRRVMSVFMVSFLCHLPQDLRGGSLAVCHSQHKICIANVHSRWAGGERQRKKMVQARATHWYCGLIPISQPGQP